MCCLASNAPKNFTEHPLDFILAKDINETFAPRHVLQCADHINERHAARSHCGHARNASLAKVSEAIVLGNVVRLHRGQEFLVATFWVASDA
jgi:hypothetical protein